MKNLVIQKMKLALDIFSGSGSFSKVSSSLGYETISLDIRRRKGVCEPTIKANILDLPDDFFCSLNPSVVWVGLPCDIWSNASGGFHLDKDFNPKTKKAVEHLAIFKKTTSMLKLLSAAYFFIENPRGKLRNYPGLLKFMNETNSVIKECTLSSYGFSTTKPTNIITNFQRLKLKELDSFGRGAKNKVPGTFCNMTKTQRQKTPEKLIKDVLLQIHNS